MIFARIPPSSGDLFPHSVVIRRATLRPTCFIFRLFSNFDCLSIDSIDFSVEMSSLSYYDAMELPPGTPPQIGDRYVIDTDEGQKMAVIKNYNEGERSFASTLSVADRNRHPLMSGASVKLKKENKF